jgi:thiol-disulfide isomerase/thioredoxin
MYMKKIDIMPGKENLFYDEVGKRPIFVKFYMDGCPHCENMKPAWNELENDLINNYEGDFTIMAVNANALNTLKSPIIENVEGFPTIFIINKDGSKGIDYNGDRSKADMLNFVLSNFNIKKMRSPTTYPLRVKKQNIRKTKSKKIKKSKKSKKSKKNIKRTRKYRG